MRKVGIGQNIKTLLYKFNKKNSDLAEYLNVSNSLVSSYINKETYPPLDKVIKMTVFFDTTLDDLVYEKDKNEFNLILEPSVIYKLKDKTVCVLTGGDCSFREIDSLRSENNRIKEELERLRGLR